MIQIGNASYRTCQRTSRRRSTERGPPFFDGDTTSPTITYTTQTGNYVRIGELVWINANIDVSTVSGGSGRLLCYGLPFPTKATAISEFMDGVALFTSIAAGSSRSIMNVRARLNSSLLDFFLVRADASDPSAQSPSFVDVTDLNTSTEILFQMAYIRQPPTIS